MTKVTVFLKTGQSVFCPYKPGQALTEVFSFNLETREGRLDPTVIANHCFAAFNDHPNPGWEPRREAYYAAGNRSLSVGDVVVIGEIACAVERVGWKFTSIPSEVTS